MLPNSEVENGYALLNGWDMNKDFVACRLEQNFPTAANESAAVTLCGLTTQFVLFGRRGNLPIREAGRQIPDAFEAPVGRHSEKHGKFYEIVRAIWFPPYGEAFRRRAP